MAISKTQFILPCADDNGNPMCYICRKYVSSVKNLYNHMIHHTDSQWRDILPHKPKKSTVSARLKLLPNSTSSDQSSNLTINDEAGPSNDREAVDLMKFLPPWKVKDRRGRQDLKNTVEEHDKDEVLLENKAGGKVVFDFDLNDDPVNDDGR